MTIRTKKNWLNFFMLSACIISICIQPASAYNFKPGVQEGDLVVWKYKLFENITTSEPYSIEYYNITVGVIYDDGPDTYLNYSYHPQGAPEGYLSNKTQLFTDFHSNPTAILSSEYFLPKGTKFSDYYDSWVTNFMTEEAIEIIDDGWGYKISVGSINTTTKFNQDGLCEKMTIDFLAIYHEQTLYSINGKAYNPNSISGFNFLVLGAGSFLALGYILIAKNRKDAIRIPQ